MLDLTSTVQAIHKVGNPTVMYITGGGTEAFNLLLRNGEGSQTLQEGVIKSKCEYVSSEATRKLAVSAYQRSLSLGAENGHGIAAIAELDKSREVYIAYQNKNQTSVTTLTFKDKPYREFEESICASAIINEIASWYKVSDRFISPLIQTYYKPNGTTVHVDENREEKSTTDKISELLEEKACVIMEGINAERSTFKPLVFSDSFNPLHDKHLEIAKAASEKMDGRLVWLELSITDTDKSTLDYISLFSRLEQMKSFVKAKNATHIGGITITNQALFTQKVSQYYHPTFIMDGNTYNCFTDSKYYSSDMEEIKLELANSYARFLIFSKKGIRTRYSPLRHLCEFINEDEYINNDTSSTLVRTTHE